MTQFDAPPLQPTAPSAGKTSWFGRHKIASGFLALLALAAVVSAAGGGGSGDAKVTASGSSKIAPGEGLQADGATWIYGDWKITNFQVDEQSWGSFKMIADATYTGKDNSGGDRCFDVSLDRETRQVASGMACASNIQPGNTATLDFFTADDYTRGPWGITLTKSW